MQTVTPPDILKQRLRTAKKPEDLRRALDEYSRSSEVNAEGHIRAHGIQLACREGCAFCCYFRVHVRAHEALFIADFIQAKFSAAQQAALISKLRQHVDSVSRMTELEHQTTNVPCPLLDGSRCSVYSARPFACRGFHSLNVSSCQYSFDHPEDIDEQRPFNQGLHETWHGMTRAAHDVYEEAGFDDTPYELGRALLEALTNPASAKRWRDRKRAFPQPKS